MRAAFRVFIVLVPLLVGLVSPGFTFAANCQFVLGFKALHDLIPNTVGNCLVDEHHNADNGDALQEMTGGLLVWRKADNWTAFTDGYRTWINGPNGLQERLNTERFSWEQPQQTLSPQLVTYCYRAANLISTTLGPYITTQASNIAWQSWLNSFRSGNTTSPPPQLQHIDLDQFAKNLNQSCQSDALKDGTKGVDCFQWSWSTLATVMTTSGVPDINTAVNSWYQGCLAH